MTDRDSRALWWRWTAANAVGEMVGLGATAGVAFLAVRRLDGSGAAAVVVAAVLVLTGAFEGVCVGVAQWRVLQGVRPLLPAQRWVRATVVGAVLAWSLGMLPSTLAAMAAPPAATDGGPFDGLLQYLLAAAMGLALGPVLAIPQWRVLRGHVRHAWWWIPANGAAWAVGMPVIFAAAGGVPATLDPVEIAAVILAALAAAGAVVGAVHGAVLVRLVSPAESA